MKWVAVAVALSFALSVLLGRFCALSNEPDSLAEEEIV